MPLNEEHGIVEWVSHTRVLRDIILKYLKQRGIHYNVYNLYILANWKYTEIKTILESKTTDPSPADRFTNELLPKSYFFLDMH